MERADFFQEYTFPTKQQMLQRKLKYNEVPITSNHFPLYFSKDIVFNQWHIRFFEPEKRQQILAGAKNLDQSVPSDSRLLIQEIIIKNSKEIRQTVGGFFFSGVTLFSFAQQTLEQDTYLFSEHSEHLMYIELKHDRLDLRDIENLQDRSVTARLTRYLNSMIKNCMKRMNYFAWGRYPRFFNAKDFAKIRQHNLIIFKGFETSIDLYEGGLKMMIDYSTKVVQDVSIWDDFLYQGGLKWSREEQRSFFIGKTLMSNYGNNKVYRVDDVNFQLRITSPFPDKKFKNFEDYFLDRYKFRKLKHQDQFLLISRQVRREMKKGGGFEKRYDDIVLIPELMLPTGLPDVNERMRGEIMRDIGKYTIVPPEQRFKLIEEFNERINRESYDNTDFNFIIDQKSNKIKGYKIDPPYLSSQNRAISIRNGRIDFNRLDKAKDLDNWVFLYQENDKDCDIVIKLLKNAGRSFDIRIKEPMARIKLPHKFSSRHVEDLISRKVDERNVDLIFVMIRKNYSSRAYKKLKQLYLRKGIPTQFFTSFSFAKDKNIRFASKYTNVLTQMIVKLGGNLWNVDVDLPNTMVAGADVYHGPKNQSASSLVVQSGRDFSEFFSIPKIQQKGQEVMENMAENILRSIRNYNKNHGRLPENFIFFRDGVGEGQLNQILELEVKAIIQKSQIEFGQKSPKFCFVVVTKRISDRFAVEGRNGLDNPKGGLLVLDNVTKKNRANFYLIAQDVNRGTATPTHYEVIFNNSSLELDKVIEVAYSFTHGYSNWRGPVKVPSCVQYAHKQASLIGVTQDDTVNWNLRAKRYYM